MNHLLECGSDYVTFPLKFYTATGSSNLATDYFSSFILPHSPSLYCTAFQPHCPSYGSSGKPCSFLPQNLCTCSLFPQLGMSLNPNPSFSWLTYPSALISKIRISRKPDQYPFWVKYFLINSGRTTCAISFQSFCLHLQTHICGFQTLITIALCWTINSRKEMERFPFTHAAFLVSGKVIQYLGNKQVTELTWATWSSS